MKKPGLKMYILSALLIAAALAFFPALREANAADSIEITSREPGNGASGVVASSGRGVTVTFNGTGLSLSPGYTPYIYWYDGNPSHTWADSCAPCAGVLLDVTGNILTFSLPDAFPGGFPNNTAFGIMLPGPGNVNANSLGYTGNVFDSQNAGTVFAGIDFPSVYALIDGASPGFTGCWTFRTAICYERPALNTAMPILPAPGTINIDPNAEIHLYFDQPVYLNAGKYIRIYKYDNDELVKQIGADSGQVEIVGTLSMEVKISGQGLQKNTAYYITIENDAFLSSWNGLSYGGVLDKSLYFTTTSTYEVKFFADGVQLGDTQIVDFSCSAEAPDTPIKEGFIFDCWDKPFMNVTGNLDVNAVFRRLFTLTYGADGHGHIDGASPQQAAEGGNGTEVIAAADEHYHFDHWSDGYPAAARTDMGVSADINATVYFAADTFTLNYGTNGNGTVSGEANQTIGYGGSGTAVTAVPNAGYHFVKWSDGIPDASRTDTNVQGNISVTAEFASITFTLGYLSGGNGIIEGNAAQTVPSGGSGTAVTATPVLGYHFLRWSDGKTNAIRTDAGVTGNISVTAMFEINTYSLKYSAGEHGSITGNLDQRVNYGSAGTQIIAAPASHYHFTKWSDGVATSYRTDKNVVKDINVTAEFAINKYKVTFEDYDGTAVKTQYVAYGSDATPPGDPERAGYTFGGWDGDYYEITAAATITARYDINMYKVTFADYDGTELKTQSVTFGLGAAPPSDPVRAGYTFTGWDGDYTKITGTVKFTAQYKANTFKVTFVNYDGSIIGSQDVESGKDAAPPADPVREGYVFTGWDLGFTGVKADITVTAQYRAALIVTKAGIQDDSPAVVVNAQGLGVTEASVEGGKAIVNADGTITLEFPNGMKAGNVEVTLTLTDGTIIKETVTITDEAVAAAAANDKAGPPFWIWIGIGGLVVAAATLITIFVRRLR